LMDAFVRNKCEKEFLSIMKEAARLLEIEIQIDSEAHHEGGLRDIWKLIGNNTNQITLLLLAATLYFQACPRTNKEIEDLQKEDLKKGIQEKSLNIEILKRELQKDSVKISADTITKAVSIFELNFKLNKHKSNFYWNLISYPKVSNDNEKPVETPAKVERKDFSRYIMVSDEIPTSPIENATIDIISPVLKKGNYKWKGYYEGKPIDFFMKDEQYKQSVIKGEVSFQNGNGIVCVLSFSRKLDEEGEIQNYNYSVTTVLKKVELGQELETAQGRIYWERKELEKQQTRLDFNNPSA
jgi:hypothetical protein